MAKCSIAMPISPDREEVIFVPTVIFIKNAIKVVPKSAKNAHFFHLNKNIANIKLEVDKTPRENGAHEETFIDVRSPPVRKYNNAPIGLKTKNNIKRNVRNPPLFLSGLGIFRLYISRL